MQADSKALYNWMWKGSSDERDTINNKIVLFRYQQDYQIKMYSNDDMFNCGHTA